VANLVLATGPTQLSPVHKAADLGGVREIDGKVEIETRFYITSLALLAAAVNPMIRSHWMIENGLHWVLDMVFRDDDCRLRTDNAPFILGMVKQLALNVLITGKSKDSLRMRRKVAAWDDNALAAYLAA
jgi:predicted transposase YbfD/YdcC